MKIFISYVTTHKIIAGKIKESLESFGYSCFLAHEDIQPTQNWIDEILKKLDDTQILLAIITDGFANSEWCNQEIGYFIGREKLIIPIKVNENPPGFISKFQALKVSQHDPSVTPSQINEIIGKSVYLNNEFKEFLVNVFDKSPSYPDADLRSEELFKLQGYSKDQVEKILMSSINNSQIFDCFRAKPRIKNFINGLTMNINQALVDQALRKL